MNRLKLEIKAAFDGQPPILSRDPDLKCVLAELREIIGKPDEQRLLGLFVMSMLSDRIKSGLKAERAISNALGVKGNDADQP
jgi:hypothetical protein